MTPLYAQRCWLGPEFVPGSPRVVEFCRKLILSGVDPATPMHVIDDDRMVGRVRSIREGAGL